MFRRKSRRRVAVIKIEGIIADSEAAGGSRSKIVAALRAAGQRSSAVVLRINSPGGSVAACQEVHSATLRLREKGLPVVASLGDVAASGGVYISMAADEIVANPGTVTGSIGVIIRGSDFSHLYNRVGVSPKVVKSGPYKDMLATYRSFSEDEQRLLQSVIDDSHDQFVQAVATGRGKPVPEIAEIADGRIMTGRQALNYGLVDALGDLRDAILIAARRAGIEGEPSPLLIQPRRSLLQRVMSPFQGTPLDPLAGIPLWILPTI